MIVVIWIIVYVQICTFIVGPSSYINGIVSVRTSGHDDQFLTLMKCYNAKTALHQVYTLVQHFSNNYIYRS